MPKPLAIFLRGASGPPALPGYSHRDPSVPTAITSESASAVQVPAVKGFHAPPKPRRTTLNGAQPDAPFPAYIPRSPVRATTASTSAMWSPLKSRGYDGAEPTLVGMSHSDRRPRAARRAAPVTFTVPADPTTDAVTTRPPHCPCPTRLRTWSARYVPIDGQRSSIVDTRTVSDQVLLALAAMPSKGSALATK